MTEKLSSTALKRASRAAIAPFYVMQALSEAEKLAAAGQEIVHLSLGQPATSPPEAVLKQVAAKAMSDNLGYTESAGIRPLREAIAAHYRAQYGVEVDSAQIFVTVGSSAAYMLSLLCAFDVGDEVALVSPHYPASPNMMEALGVQPVIMPSSAESNYQPTVEMLRKLPRKPAGLVIASPSNPTGTVIDPAELARLVRYCEQEQIRIISDEIYHGVTYGGVQASSVLESSDQMIVTNSFSKYYLLPGWRLGWCVMPKALIGAAEAILQNFYISPPTLSQYAALEVMQHRDALDAVVAGYDANRRYLLAHLPEVGLRHFAPAQGAFYLYADVSELTNDSVRFCRDMLEQAGVCAVPGIDFDRTSGHHYIRFSYAGSLEAMQAACERLRNWLG